MPLLPSGVPCGFFAFDALGEVFLAEVSFDGVFRRTRSWRHPALPAWLHAAHRGIAPYARAVLKQTQIKLPGGDIHVYDLDFGAVSQGDAAAGALAAEDAGTFVELPEVVGEVGDA